MPIASRVARSIQHCKALTLDAPRDHNLCSRVVPVASFEHLCLLSITARRGLDLSCYATSPFVGYWLSRLDQTESNSSGEGYQSSSTYIVRDICSTQVIPCGAVRKHKRAQIAGSWRVRKRAVLTVTSARWCERIAGSNSGGLNAGRHPA